MKAKSVGKYGMPYRTIKYWQDQARDLYRYNGLYAGRSVLERRIVQATAQEIGHAAIGLAAVASREHLIATLTGTRRGRWIV